jgi:hypothetical protein
MNPRWLGTATRSPPTWRDRLLAGVGAVLAAVLAIGAATVGIVVGLLAMVVLVPLVWLGVLRLRRLLRKTAAEHRATGAGRGELIEGEFQVVGEPREPFRPRPGKRLPPSDTPGQGQPPG